MKFVLIVLAVHFIAEMVNSRNRNEGNEKEEMRQDVRHPAEFNLR